MTKKKKTVWHKKQGHFIPSTRIESPAHLTPTPELAPAPAAPSEKRKQFAQHLSNLIKKAAREAS